MDENYDTAFLDQLASGNPTPGGGSASSFTAAESAALVAMVARTTTGKKKYQSVENEIAETIEKAESWRAELQKNIQRDAMAFNAIIQASRLPKNTPQEESDRKEALQKSYLQAAEIPLDIAAITLKVMAAAVRLAEIANLNAIADAAAAAALARAVITISKNNIKINLKGLPENLRAREILSEILEIVSQSEQLNLQMIRCLEARGGIS
jgi:formiminotetrahydrofolate cyclodeaminase